MAGKIKSCGMFRHDYPPRSTGRIGRLGFDRLCRKCGKPALP